jgi:hypothetical protein
MEHSKRTRPRCRQCRKRFTPSASALGKQRVCSKKCREERDLALARERRSKDLKRYREDEWERQRKCREARRAAARSAAPAGPAVVKCHAPPSVANQRKLRRKVLRSWDIVAALSRATLAQKLGEILEENEAFGAVAWTEGVAVTSQPRSAIS